jgi:hypothetical protein
VPLGKTGRKLVSLINRPAHTAEAKYEYSSEEPGECNNGVAYSLKLEDVTSINIFDAKEIELFKFKSPDLLGGCFL